MKHILLKTAFAFAVSLSSVSCFDLEEEVFDRVDASIYYSDENSVKGAVAAIWIKTKNAKTRSLCPPALISGIAGVTEPAIYGITLPKKKPFIITCIVGAITGAGLMATGVTGYTMAGLGVFGYTAYVNTATNDISGMIWGIVWSLIAVVLAFVMVYFTYSDEPAKKKV